MDLGGLVEKSLTGLGARFGLVSLLPAAVFVIFGGFLVLGGAPAHAPQFGAVLHTVGAWGPTEGVLLGIAAVALAIVLQPFQTFFVRILEGYWGSSAPAAFLSRLFAKRHRTRRDRIKSAKERLEAAAQNPTVAEPGQAYEAAILADRLVRSYPLDKFLPTKLGNVLRAAEENAGAPYGLDAIAIWPLLYTVLPKRTAALLDDQRNQLDIAASFCVMGGMATLASACLLYRHGWWLLVPVATLLLTWIAYRGAILSAFAYGTGIRMAIDLHRFDLLTALHLPLPADASSERQYNKVLSDFLRQGTPENFKYEHRPRNRAADAPGSASD